MTILRTILLASVALSVAGAANASGILPQPGPGPVVVAPVAHDWSGFYGGVLLGASDGEYFGDFNTAAVGGGFPGSDTDTGALDGGLAGAVIGYNFQSGAFVYGAELAFYGTDISGSESCNLPTFNCDIEIDQLAVLRARMGYALGDRGMVFGSVGIAQAQVSAQTFNIGAGTAFPDDGTLRGTTFGLGADYAVTDRIIVRGSVNYYSFNPESFVFDIVYDEVQFDTTTFEIGILFQF